MLVKTGASVTTTFSTHTPTTGAAANADSLPTATLYVDGTANGASVTVTNITTGLYKAAVTLPTLTAGQVVSIVVSATVATVADTSKVWESVADTLRVSDTLTANPAAGGIASASFATGATIPRVTLADTVTTYTGNTPQTGDAYARIGAAGAGLTAVATAAALVTAQADLTTLTGRLTSARAGYLDALAGFTGTVRQALRALAAKAAGETSADLTGGTSTYDNTTDSQEAAIDNATGATPATFWTYANRTLTQGAASVVTAVSGSTVTAYRGGYLSATLTGLADMTGWTRIYFTVKNDPVADADSASVLQLRKTSPPDGTNDGLLYAAGAAATKADGSITVNSATSITVVVKNAATALLTADSVAQYDVWYIGSDGQPRPASEGGKFVIVPAVTLATS